MKENERGIDKRLQRRISQSAVFEVNFCTGSSTTYKDESMEARRRIGLNAYYSYNDIV